MNLKDSETAKAWIKNYESKNDNYRVKYLEPYIKKVINKVHNNSKILDIGCGWGMVTKFIKPFQEYTGIDINKNFFRYILKNQSKKKIKLLEGKLPEKINVKDNYFNLVICSMTIHSTPKIKKDIQVLFKKAKKSGKVVIIDFKNSAEKILRKTCVKKKKETKDYIKGIYTLPSGIEVYSETYFFKEKEYETEIKKYGKFKKVNVGPIFVAYECTKN
ncbi:MAG: class I SAM-dependent methyltransferase [Candidatus Pacearchaeota archaeon]|jgi:ubiquinone/menaquinone biosynthesis C-methylase UbiE